MKISNPNKDTCFHEKGPKKAFNSPNVLGAEDTRNMYVLVLNDTNW